jgi:hypothetical protein
VKWFANWFFKPILALTYFGAAFLLFLLWWPLGLVGFVLALLFYQADSLSIDAEESADSCRPKDPT